MNEKCGADAHRTLDLDIAVMFLDDLMHDRQAESGTFMFSALMLGRKEGIEDMFKIRFLDAMACIFRLDLHPLFPAGFHEFSRSDSQRSTPVSHRVHSVEKQVEKDLLDLLTVQHDTR